MPDTVLACHDLREIKACDRITPLPILLPCFGKRIKKDRTQVWNQCNIAQLFQGLIAFLALAATIG